ncbi:endonuclease [Brucella anthropi]|uniref:endonuclease n=1 Tax=Brucella anthropi TaxID=529 RepID=UPI00124DEFF3|nr:endonuclease [Brucella anthropi]KAB2780495.1 endonuclease [Brucella anthropi]KAB2789377.1 endonuclease [Brucella anthropi]
MTSRAPSICSHCRKAHTSENPCATVMRLAKERKARFDKKRPNATQRGYDRTWEREAKAFLSQPENQCCARCGSKATVVMHIQSIRLRPDLRMVRSNWRPGCQRCNAIEAAQERHNLKEG